MRLEGQAKAGFYPTPGEVAGLIGSCLVAEHPSYLLDPCCGEGEALERVNVAVQGSTRLVTHGVELEQERAKVAQNVLDHVLVGDSLKARAKGKYGGLYLNPPYDQADGTRLELAFLWHWQRSLLPGGVLVYVVPEKYLSEYEATLTAHFERLTIFRFPDEHYDAFKQVVVKLCRSTDAACRTPTALRISTLGLTKELTSLPPMASRLRPTILDRGKNEILASYWSSWPVAAYGRTFVRDQHWTCLADRPTTDVTRLCPAFYGAREKVGN